MMPFRDTGVLDRNSEALGVPPSELMANAGRAVAEFVLGEFSPKKVLIACGPGNNGGDGFVAARHIDESGVSVSIIAPREPSTDLAIVAAERVAGIVERVTVDELSVSLKEVDVVIDALLGVGVTRPIGGTLKELLDEVRQALEPAANSGLAETVPE